MSSGTGTRAGAGAGVGFGEINFQSRSRPKTGRLRNPDLWDCSMKNKMKVSCRFFF